MKRLLNTLAFIGAGIIPVLASNLSGGKAEKAVEAIKTVTEDGGFWTAGSIIGMALALVALGVAVWLFMRLTELRKEFEKFKKTTSTELKNSHKAELEQTAIINKMQSSLAAIKEMVVASSARQAGSHAKHQANQTIAPEPVANGPVPAEPVPSPTPRIQPREWFVGPARANQFAGGRPTFTPGQSIFRINDKGGATAEFQFADKREALLVALRSISDFIEPACEIVGEPADNPTKVKTLAPGVVRRNGDNWVIENKTQIQLV